MNRTPRRHLLAPAFAFCATLLALPSAAVTIPDVPLQSGSAYPPANVMFILDDSGSMEFDFMPGSDSASEVPATTPVNVALNAYTRNTLYYNPGITYLPWVRADDTRYSGGTSYNSAYSHDSLLSDAINLGASTRTF
jgi:type IV pilus assembly protein PilY1